jgi:diadenosine tetraphosphate (Ap4A) HIT family hydrolase
MSNNQSEPFQRLSDFINNKMQMSQIYQPVMLIKIIQNGGEASVQEIAKEILGHDESQIEYYEERTRRMVGNVLTDNNHITEKIKTGRSITGYKISGAEELSSEETAQLLQLCQQKIEEFLEQRGSKVWSHRKKSSGYISGTIRYEVLKRAKFRCELCGISAEDKALEVDHILPRNHGGQDDLSNFQALCYSCNAMKRDRDDTDFRGMAESYKLRERGCLFCEIEESRIIAENELCYATRDGFPVTEHHTLVIPKRHTPDYFELHRPEINAIHSMMDKVKGEIEKIDEMVTGFNVGINNGTDAGQTINHCHIHLIPRREGDMDDPKGGVRGVIPEKQKY